VTPHPWEELDRSGKTDGDIEPIGLEQGDPRIEQRLTQALFLFAIRTIQGAQPGEIKDIWLRYQRYWIRRLPEEAYYYVKCECARLANLSHECRARSEDACKQLTMRGVMDEDDEEPF
jgi:hypothetical protein